MDPFALASRSVIHVDIDSFFLAVHMRQDATLDASKPLVLWQYQDVVCANRPAKALGVKKHMRPSEARALVDKSGGRLVHAFCRTWPGPRVDYSNYNSASREFFRAFQEGGYAPHGLLYNNVAICLLRDRRDAEAKEVWRLGTSDAALAPVPADRARKIRQNYADVLGWDRALGKPFRGTLVW